MLNNTAREIISYLPRWMKIYTQPEDTQGGKLINVLAGRIEEIKSLIDNCLLSHFPQTELNSVDGIDIFNIDYIYKAEIPASQVESINKVQCINNNSSTPTIFTRVDSQYKFFLSTNENVYYYDEDVQVIYIKEEFNKIVINNNLVFELNIHHVWGPYDEMGLLLACPRIPNERNEEYKQRLLDVYMNPGNATLQGLKNYISRSIRTEDLPITPDDIIIDELTDELVNENIGEDGSVSSKLQEYIKLSDAVNMSNDNTYWEIIENDSKGINYLPIPWTQTLDNFSEEYIQSGVASYQDLKVIEPDLQDNEQSFNYRIGIKGIRYSKKKRYPEIRFKYKIKAKGKTLGSALAPQRYKFKVQAAEHIPLKFDINAKKEYRDFISYIQDGSIMKEVHINDVNNRTQTVEFDSDYELQNIQVVDGNDVVNGSNCTSVVILVELISDDPSKSPALKTIRLQTTNPTENNNILLTDGDMSDVVVFDNKIILDKHRYVKEYIEDDDWYTGIMTNIEVVGQKIRLNIRSDI